MTISQKRMAIKEQTMKNLPCVLSAAVILVSVLLLIGSGRDGASAQQKPAEPPIGRYQVFHLVVQNQPFDCLLDTATGKTWSLAGQAGKKEWASMGEGPK